MSEVGNETQLEQSFKSYDYKCLVYSNLEIICTVSPHGLTVRQVSTRSDENCRMSSPETKCGWTDEWTVDGQKLKGIP